MIKSDDSGKWFWVIIYALPALVTLLFILILSIQLGNTFLAVHDSPLYISNEKLSSHMGLLWTSNSFGSPNYIPQAINYFSYILNFTYLSLFNSIKTGQLVFYFLIISFIWYLSWYSFNSLLALLGCNKTKLYSLIGSYFFSFNLYMIVSWHGGTIDSLFLCYAICPLVMLEISKLLLSNGLQKINAIAAILFGLCAHSGPLFLAVLLVYFSCFFLIAIAGKRWGAIKKASQFLMLTLLISLLFLPIFALFVFFGEPTPELASVGQQFYFSNLGISGLFRLYFDWTINGFWNGRFFHSYFPYFNNAFISLCAIGLWFFSLYALLEKIRDRKFSIFFLWLMSVLIISFFLAKATQPPLGIINEWLYSYAPLFSIFRTPDTKFGLTISCLLSFGIAYALSRSDNKYIKSFIFFFILLQSLPFFTTIPIIEVRKGDQFERVVSLPDGYKEIASLVNKDDSEGAILMYPGPHFANFDYFNGGGLNGQDILGALITRPVIHNDGWIFNQSKKVYESLIANPSQSDFGSASIRFVLIRKDVLKQVPKKSEFEEFSRNKQLELFVSNNIGDLYRVTNIAYRPEVSHENPLKDHLVYTKLNSTFYWLNKLSPDSKRIIFNQSFHPGWILCPIPPHPHWISGFTSLFQMYIQFTCPAMAAIHQPSFQGFNSWEISPVFTSKNEYALIFSPQAFWNMLKIFVFGLILIITLTIFISKIKKNAP